jgi:hypothetical protein
MSKKFYKCDLFSYYYGNGLFWFKILNIGLSFKHIYNYKFNINDKNMDGTFKGMFFKYWLVNII